MREDEEDAFWAIELEGGSRALVKDESDTAEEDAAGLATRRAHLYRIPNHEDGSTIAVRLAPLPMVDGIWSPVGADIWFGSAVLTALLLRRRPSKDVVLELGCGATALAGIAAGLSCGANKVYLTDNEPSVLRQLRTNVSSVVQQHDGLESRFEVRCLDWADESLEGIEDVESIDHIIGAELVYTPEGGKACVGCVDRLLERFPQATVTIVQVTDREGWNEVFVPAMEVKYRVRQEVVPADCHDEARRMVEHGGSLDRFDLGVCYISNR